MPGFAKVTFTGSTEVGKILTRQASGHVEARQHGTRRSRAVHHFEDADIEQAVKDVVASKFRNAGQTCVCTNRVYVLRSILEEFTAQFSSAVAALRLGDPLEASTQMDRSWTRKGWRRSRRTSRMP